MLSGGMQASNYILIRAARDIEKRNVALTFHCINVRDITRVSHHSNYLLSTVRIHHWKNSSQHWREKTKTEDQDQLWSTKRHQEWSRKIKRSVTTSWTPSSNFLATSLVPQWLFQSFLIANMWRKKVQKTKTSFEVPRDIKNEAVK